VVIVGARLPSYKYTGVSADRVVDDTNLFEVLLHPFVRILDRRIFGVLTALICPAPAIRERDDLRQTFFGEGDGSGGGKQQGNKYNHNDPLHGNSPFEC